MQTPDELAWSCDWMWYQIETGAKLNIIKYFLNSLGSFMYIYVSQTSQCQAFLSTLLSKNCVTRYQWRKANFPKTLSYSLCSVTPMFGFEHLWCPKTCEEIYSNIDKMCKNALWVSCASVPLLLPFLNKQSNLC